MAIQTADYTAGVLPLHRTSKMSPSYAIEA